MRTPLDFVLFLLAVILFALVMLGVNARWVNLLAAGLLAFTLPFLIEAWPS